MGIINSKDKRFMLACGLRSLRVWSYDSIAFRPVTSQGHHGNYMIKKSCSPHSSHEEDKERVELGTMEGGQTVVGMYYTREEFL